MTVGEALTNLVWARVTRRQDVKCSANWMWPAKLEGESARMWEACEAMCDSLKVRFLVFLAGRLLACFLDTYLIVCDIGD
jgi:hypothetical protein